MRYSLVGATWKGQVKAENQDSYLIQRAETPWGEVALALVADGMGGLSCGELASATVARGFREWFQRDLPFVLQQLGGQGAAFSQAVQSQWLGVLQKANLELMRYGSDQGIQLGTTCTALLAYGQSCLLAQVGDSRAYELSGGEAAQLTEDQTFEAREMAAGRMTAAEARVHPQRGALTQCVGASPALLPVITHATLRPQVTYVLCSDGFRHTLTPTEMATLLRYDALQDQSSDQVKQLLQKMFATLEARGERDNMTAVLLRTEEGGGSCWQ